MYSVASWAHFLNRLLTAAAGRRRPRSGSRARWLGIMGMARPSSGGGARPGRTPARRARAHLPAAPRRSRRSRAPPPRPPGARAPRPSPAPPGGGPSLRRRPTPPVSGRPPKCAGALGSEERLHDERNSNERRHGPPPTPGALTAPGMQHSSQLV